MHVSDTLLRHRVPGLPAEPDAIAALLRERDVTVASVVPLAELLRPVVVGRVETLTQHPNADRLKVCVVDDGTETRLQIVTGADNVQAGALYPLIRGGTSLPSGRKIKRGKLRGEVSEGMLGSADELELGTDHAGLLTLPEGLTPGTPLPDAMPVDGYVFVLEGVDDVEDVVRALGGEARPKEEAAPASAEDRNASTSSETETAPKPETGPRPETPSA